LATTPSGTVKEFQNLGAINNNYYSCTRLAPFIPFCHLAIQVTNTLQLSADQRDVLQWLKVLSKNTHTQNIQQKEMTNIKLARMQSRLLPGRFLHPYSSYYLIYQFIESEEI